MSHADCGLSAVLKTSALICGESKATIRNPGSERAATIFRAVDATPATFLSVPAPANSATYFVVAVSSANKVMVEKTDWIALRNGSSPISVGFRIRVRATYARK